MTDFFSSALVIPALIVLVVIVGAIVLMAIGWRNRRRRQAVMGPLPTPPAELGDIVHSEDALYLATTRAEEPLDRIAITGLGYRAEARVSITASGILLELVGEAPIFIASPLVRGVGVATWTVDRGVERDGLIFVRWDLNDTTVDSYLRSADLPTLLAALNQLVPPTDSAPTDSAPTDSAPTESDNT